MDAAMRATSARATDMAATAVRANGSTAPFRWSPQFAFQAPSTAGAALDVNASGTVLADDDHVYPLGGSPIAFPTTYETGAFSMGTAINDSGWVAGVYTLRADDALPPPQAGAWKIGTDSVVPVPTDWFSQGIDVNNAGLMIGMDSQNNFDGWVEDIHQH